MNQEIDLAKAKLYLTHLQLAVTEFENANGVKIKRERRADGTFGSGVVKSTEKAINDGIDFVKKEAEEIEDRIKSFLGLDKGVMVQNLLKNPENVKILKDLDIDPGKLLEAANKQKNGIPDKAKVKELKNRLAELTPPNKLIEEAFKIASNEIKETDSEKFNDLYTTLLHELSTEKYGIQNQIKNANGVGYSLERRTKEMVDLYKKEGKDSREVQWRKFIVKSELEFGDKLNQIQSSKSNSSEINKNYQSLLKGMEQTKGVIKIEKVKFRNEDDNNMVDEAVKSVQELGKIIGTNIDVTITSNPNNPMGIGMMSIKDRKGVVGKLLLGTVSGIKKAEVFTQDPRIEEGRIERDVELDPLKFSSKNDFDRMIVWHEMGHLYETTNDLGNTTIKLINQREKESIFSPDLDGLKKIRERILNKLKGFKELNIEKTDEPFHGKYQNSKIRMAIDDFYMDYAGAIYEKSFLPSTELISTGFECLSDPEMLKRVSAKDREQMLYTIGSIMYGGK